MLLAEDVWAIFYLKYIRGSIHFRTQYLTCSEKSRLLRRRYLWLKQRKVHFREAGIYPWERRTRVASGDILSLLMLSSLRRGYEFCCKAAPALITRNKQNHNHTFAYLVWQKNLLNVIWVKFRLSFVDRKRRFLQNFPKLHSGLSNRSQVASRLWSSIVG